MNYDTPTTSGELLVFETAGRRFGLFARNVREVLQAMTTTAAPRPQAAIKGVINLRGHVMPVLDLRMLFDLPAKDIEHVDHIIVFESGGQFAALHVDRALELARIPPNDFEPAENIAQHWEAVASVAKAAGELVFVLDPDALLTQIESGSNSLAEATP